MGLLINGSVQGMISPSCGLRQGDLLSPALFIIAADVLSRLITERKNEGHIQGFKISRDGPAITHLMFADDVMLFGKATVKEATGFLKCLQEYCSASGQAVNYHKSTVYFSKGVSTGVAREIADLLNMKRMKKDATYLGLPLFKSLNRSKDLYFLVDRALQRVKIWKTRLLSKAGRACLIQSVGSSLTSYVAASDPIPRNIAQKVDKCLRDFWWGDTNDKRKIHLIAWNNLCQPKLRGGLGFRSTEVINKAFLAKWAWKALTDKTSVWGQVVNAKYIRGRNFLTIERNGGDSGFWKAILDARGVLEKGLCRKIGNGEKTSIWFDPWVPASNRTPVPLKDVSHGVAWVKQFLTSTNRWKVDMVREWFREEDVKAILNIDLPDVTTEDSWVWMGEQHGSFSLKSACRFIKGEPSPHTADGPSGLAVVGASGLKMLMCQIGNSDWNDIALSSTGCLLSVVVRDEFGIIRTITTLKDLTTNPKLGEARAVCLAAETAVKAGLCKVMFQTDNLVVVKAFESHEECCVDFRLQTAKVQFLNWCSKLSDWKIFHIPRKCNFMAHNIAKWAIASNTEGQINPQTLEATVLDDLVEWDPGALNVWRS
uniref:Reverse transcriptase domain-containing protein n=1 Tax=Cannabis sativa TaxID=3483 RepID=A0A803QJL6_CANSA